MADMSTKFPDPMGEYGMGGRKPMQTPRLSGSKKAGVVEGRGYEQYGGRMPVVTPEAVQRARISGQTVTKMERKKPTAKLPEGLPPMAQDIM
jgi:hypothetical protein